MQERRDSWRDDRQKWDRVNDEDEEKGVGYNTGRMQISDDKEGMIREILRGCVLTSESIPNRLNEFNSQNWLIIHLKKFAR